MGRIFNAVLLAVMVTGAAITYTMKHNAEAMANHVAQLAAGAPTLPARSVHANPWPGALHPAFETAETDRFV